MINKENLNFLKTRPGDIAFHRARIMFCIKEGNVKIGPKEVSDSHIEWFEKEGWVKEENAEEFLKNNIRGFYLPAQNKLYCYRGIGFSFDDKVLPELLGKIKDLKNGFNLNEDTEIHLGPIDSFIGGVKYQKLFAGKLKKFV